MSEIIMSDDKLKQLMKAAFIEALEERKDLFRELIDEALEDIGLVQAIEEGRSSGSVSREEIFKILDGNN
ncbi:MAG: hypothetical protein HY961_16785 [Ignavibacteriae bacterium]|nr:hypothetical protein [Ignavibacteriota bacterium]